MRSRCGTGSSQAEAAAWSECQIAAEPRGNSHRSARRWSTMIRPLESALFCNGCSPMPEIVNRIEIEADPEVVYRAARDVERFPEFMPEVKSVVVVERSPDG